MQNYLLEGEEIIQYSPNNVVVLTTHRIRYHSDSSSHAHLVSVMLEKVSSCEVRYQSHFVLLVLGILISVFGVFSLTQAFGSNLGMVLIVIGFILTVTYFVTRKHIVSIASDGGARIGFETKGMKKESVVSLVNNLEKAKHWRMVNLARVSRAVHAA